MQKLDMRLKEVSGGNVLDVASGVGQFIAALMPALKDYDNFVGIDTHKKALEAAKAKFEGKPVEFVNMDASKMTFEDESFDTVAIQFSLHHLKELDKVLEGMLRVLKPGGYFLVSEMYVDGDQSKAQQSHIKVHHLSAELDMAKGDFHDYTYTRSSIREIMNGLQLSSLEEYDITYPMENPKDKDLITNMKAGFGKALERYKDIPNFSEFQTKLDNFFSWIDEHGYAPASSLFFIAQK